MRRIDVSENVGETSTWGVITTQHAAHSTEVTLYLLDIVSGTAVSLDP
jgi:hypothetical protein